MQSPRAFFARKVDIIGLVFQNADKTVLLGKIANPKSEMVREGR